MSYVFPAAERAPSTDNRARPLYRAPAFRLHFTNSCKGRRHYIELRRDIRIKNPQNDNHQKCLLWLKWRWTCYTNNLINLSNVSNLQWKNNIV